MASTPTDGFEDYGSQQRTLSSNTSPSGVAYWGTSPDAYDVVYLAGYAIPGLCRVRGKGYEMRRSHQRVPGKHGASTLYIANEPAMFAIQVLLVTEDHLRAFEKLIPLFKPSVKPKPSTKIGNPDAFTYAFTGQSQAASNGTTLTARTTVRDDSMPGYLSVSHPMLALFRISHCRVLQVSIPEEEEGTGMWRSTIECMEEVLEGSRKSKTGETGDAGSLTTRATAYDSVLQRNQAPSATNVGPPPK